MLQPQVPQPRVLELLEQGRGRRLAAVVDDDQLEVAAGLRERVGRGRAQPLGPRLPGRQCERDLRRVHLTNCTQRAFEGVPCPSKTNSMYQPGGATLRLGGATSRRSPWPCA